MRERPAPMTWMLVPGVGRDARWPMFVGWSYVPVRRGRGEVDVVLLSSFGVSSVAAAVAASVECRCGGCQRFCRDADGTRMGQGWSRDLMCG